MNSSKVLILSGGFSKEKEISKWSGANLYQALTNAGFHVDLLDPADKHFSFELLKDYDVIYPILHGTQGEDGCIQGVLEILQIPYIGCGVLASSLTMDKAITKKFFQSLDIPCAEGFVTSDSLEENLQKIQKIGYPVFIKPVNEGSSVGTLILHTPEEALLLLPEHLKRFPYSLIEQLLIGREMTIGMIEQHNKIIILPILELKPKAEFYTFETKYTTGMTEFILPAPIDDDMLQLIHQHVLTIFTELHLKDCIRIDLMLTEQGPIYLEVNTAPGMTNTSDIPAMLRAANIDIKDFVTQLIKNALGRYSC